MPLALKDHDKACRSRACRSTLALGDHSGTGWPLSKRKPRAMVLIQGKKAAKENDGEETYVQAAAKVDLPREPINSKALANVRHQHVSPT